MYKKIPAIVLAVTLIMTMGISAAAATEVTSFGIMDAEAVMAGTDANWSKSSSVSLYSDETYGTGLIASVGSGDVTTSDPDFSSATKRAWGRIFSTNTVSEEVTPTYTLAFDLTSVEGMYAISHGGCYIYLRSADTGNNYLANKMAIVLRRDWNGAQQIALKPTTSGGMSSFISVTNENVDLAKATIKVVDNFVTDVVKVYATDNGGEYQLIGTVTLDIANNGATLVNAEGASQSYSGYGETILDGSSKPLFILNEYSGMIGNAEISYPAEGPIGAPASVPGGAYIGFPKITLKVNDENNLVWYTVDGTDPVTSEDTRNLYTEGDIIDLNPESLALPATFTLKTVEEADGVFSDVLTYTYSVYPESASYTVDTNEVAAGTSADFAYGNTFTQYTVETENDAFGAEIWKWTQVYSKFAVPTAAGSMEYNFDVNTLNNDGDTMYGMFINFEAPNTANMTSTTNPVIYMTKKGIGFRKSSAWTGNASTIVSYPQGVSLTDDTHHIRIVTEFGGKTLVYVDDVYVAEFTISDDGTLTVTNADGVSASRTGVVKATDSAYASLALYNSTTLVKVKDLTVSYPAASATHPTATITPETIEAYVGGADVEIPVSTDDENALVYYTLDGSVPNAESDLYDGSAIVLTTPEATGSVTLKVRAYNGDYWGAVDSVTVTYKEPTVNYSYNFNEDTISSDWVQTITAGSTTMFALTEDYKLTPQENYSMLSYKENITSGKTNTISFDLQDLDSEDASISKLAFALRCVSPSEWFNSTPANSHTWLMFEGNKLGFKTAMDVASEESYTMVEVDSDFTNETKVIIVDNVEANLAGIYVQDIAETSEKKLIAYVTFEDYNDGTTDYARASLYSVLGGKVENVDFRRARTTDATFRPTFMSYNAAGLYTVDNIEITVDNVNAAVIDTMGAPAFEEMATGSEYFKAVKIAPVGEGEQKIYYTLDGTEPSKDNGTLYTQGTYIIINETTTLKAIAYNGEETTSSAVTEGNFAITASEYYKAEFVPEEVYGGTSPYWREGSNNTAGIPSFKVNDDGSFTFAGSQAETGGGVGMVATNAVFNATDNPVTITEFDAKKLGTGKNHMSFFFGMRKESYGGTEVTNNNTFFIKLSGSEIGYKNESWGAAHTGTYLETNTSFNSDSSEYQHYMIIDDKVNNTVWLFVDGMYLGKYQFSTTELENDTVTLTSVTGEQASRTYTSSIPTSGQFFIGQAYITTSSFKNLITYSGNTIPSFSVVFDAGEYGEISGESEFEVEKYTTVEEIPEVTMNIDGELLGWTMNGETTVYTAEEILAMEIVGDTLFTAQYSPNLTDVNVTVGEVTAEEGRTAVVPVEFSSEATVSGTVTLSYDNTALEYTGSEGVVTDNGDGTLTLTFEGNGTIELSFKLIGGEAGSVTAVQVTESNLTGAEDEFLNVVSKDGSVTIEVLKGDVDRDGKITVYDAVTVLKHAAGIISLEGNALAAAKVTGGEDATVTDAITILKYLARIISTL